MKDLELLQATLTDLYNLRERLRTYERNRSDAEKNHGDFWLSHKGNRVLIFDKKEVLSIFKDKIFELKQDEMKLIRKIEAI